MTKKFKGIPVSKGIAVGTAHIMDDVIEEVELRYIAESEINKEKERFNSALRTVRKELEKSVETATKHLDESKARIFETHIIMLEDELFTDRIPERIEKDRLTAESAAFKELDNVRQQFENIPDERIKERFADFKDVVGRVIKELMGKKTLMPSKAKTVVVCKELHPSTVLHLPRDKVVGIVTEMGGPTSHAAIIAHSLEIPAVFGIRDLLREVRDGDTIVVDGYDGEVVVNPDFESLNYYKQIETNYKKKRKIIVETLSKETFTADGEKVSVLANASTELDLDLARKYQAEGIGLFRTELPFLKENRFLSEEEQYKLYRHYIKKMSGREVVIRTLDIGGDKFFGPGGEFSGLKESNPFLGWRSVRILLKEKERFKEQLRAILRVSKYGKIKILIPMISSIEEIDGVKEVLEESKEELRSKKVAFDENVKLGIMIEIPSAALLANYMIDEVDFFSIGTNDLTQYTLAVDRNNETVASLYQPLNPAVLYLIWHSIHVANKKGKYVSVCGEMASEPLYIRLLLGMGLRIFSVNPMNLPEVKFIIRRSKISDARKLWNRVKRLRRAEEVEKVLLEDLKKVAPETIVTATVPG